MNASRSIDKADLHLFLSRHKYGVVSSVAADGTPQSALVGIATSPDLEIIFDTLKSTRKYANLMARPACSFVVGSGEQTVQFEGMAVEPASSERNHYQAIYFAAWPDGPSRMTWPGITHLVVHPRWIRYSDFDQRPPLIQQFADIS